MELWVRSQNKSKLIKVNSVYLPNPINANNFFPKIIANDGDYLGSYKTEERALEVLDEIQGLLKPKIIINGGKLTGDGFQDYKIQIKPSEVDISPYVSTLVYEMPEE